MNELYYAIGLIGIILLVSCARYIVHLLTEGKAKKHLPAYTGVLFIIYTLTIILACSMTVNLLEQSNADLHLIFTVLSLVFGGMNAAILFIIVMYTSIRKRT